MRVKSAEEIAEFLRPYAEAEGAELLEVKWDLRARALTVVIDAEGGVDLNLCERVHRAIDGPLDEFDPTFGAGYTLNCSSPGLDRPFKTPRDFLRHIGEKVEAKLYAPLCGKKEFEGTLLSYDGSAVVLLTSAGEKTLRLEQIAKICLSIEVD